MSEKIKTDFLKLTGNPNPKPEDVQKLNPIPDSQLLKAIVNDCKDKGLSLQQIANKYGLSKQTVASISNRTK